jgi:hypothetical protein
MAFAVSARVLEARVLQHRRFHLNIQLFAFLFAHPVQCVCAAWIDLLIFG